MGINVAVGLAHSLQAADLVELSDRVASSDEMRRAAAGLWYVMSPRWRDLEPVGQFVSFLPTELVTVNDVEAAWKLGELPRFHWAGFSLYFGQAAVRAVHIEKLAGFVLDIEGLRNALASCAHALARELQSPRIVYGPDSFSPFQEVLDVDEGRSLEKILSDAKRLCGAAAGSIRGMADENEELNLGLGCYFTEIVHLGHRAQPDDRDCD